MRVSLEAAERAVAKLAGTPYEVSYAAADAWLRERGLAIDAREITVTKINLATLEWLTEQCSDCHLCRGDVTGASKHQCAQLSWHSLDSIAGLGLTEVLAT